jgi:hypothetical protein
MVKNKNRIIAILKLIGLVVIIYLILWFFVFTDFGDDKRIKLVYDAVTKIEEYRIQNGKLPEKISETGLPEPLENDPPWYTKLNHKDYVIYFPGSTLGESTTYYSNTKQWQDF